MSLNNVRNKGGGVGVMHQAGSTDNNQPKSDSDGGGNGGGSGGGSCVGLQRG